MERIIQVVGCLEPGGLENLIMNIYRNMDREKYQFDFVVHRKIVGKFDAEVRSLGGTIYYAPRYMLFNHFEYVHWWDNFFKTHSEYKLVHSHIRSTARFILKAAKKYGVKTISHSHSTTAGRGMEGLFRKAFQKDITDYADRCLACSEAAGKWLFGNTDFTVFKNAIDTKKFSYRPNIGKKIRDEYGIGDNKVIGHIGRFHVQKNQKFLLEIFKKICKKNDDIMLMIVGGISGDDDGCLEPGELESYAKRLGIYDRCIFTGNVLNVADYMNAFDLFLLPSKYEGLPLTMIEAQASGLTCIVSNMVTEEGNLTGLVKYFGLENSSKEWAKLVLENIDNGRIDRTDRIISAGYDINDGVNRLFSVYDELINE